MCIQYQEEYIGKCQSGRVWNKLLLGKLTSSAVRFRKIKIYECVLYQGEIMYILYNADYILAGQDDGELRQIVAEIKMAGLDITEEGNIEDFLGVNIYKVKSET